MDIELNKKACAGHAQARDVIRRMPVHPISTNISLFAYAGRRTPSLCVNTGTYKSHVHGIRILSKKSILPQICFFNFTNTSTFFPTSLETSSQLYFPRVGIVRTKKDLQWCDGRISRRTLFWIYILEFGRLLVLWSTLFSPRVERYATSIKLEM